MFAGATGGHPGAPPLSGGGAATRAAPPLRSRGRPHADPLVRLGVDTETARGLEAWLDVLAAWSRRTNLTAARTAEARVRVLVEPVLPAAPLLEPGRLIDVGSGNGSPGLVLALLRPDLAATLLEPRARRWAFLKEACRASGRDDVEVLRARHDEYRGPRARNVTLRALRLGYEDVLPLVEPGGQALFFRDAAEHPAFRREPAPPGMTRCRRVSRET